MKNLKKFFAFSIATAMVAGAVWAGTPGFKSLAWGTKKYWNGVDGYVDAYVEGYTEVWEISDNNYIDYDFNKLSISPTKHEIIVGEPTNVQLYGSGSTPFDSILWTSDNSTIGTVSFEGEQSTNCTVTGNAVGTANISCIITYKGKTLPALSESITVKPDPSKVQSVKITSAAPKLVVGDTYPLEATVLPETANQDITWQTSDSSIVYIKKEDGEVYAVARKAGKATITAISKDDSTKSDKIDIIVEPKTINVTMTPEEAKLYFGGYAGVTATVESDDFTGTVLDLVRHGIIRFKSSNDSVARYGGWINEDNEDKLVFGAYGSGDATIVADVTEYSKEYFKVNSNEFKVTVSTESSKQNATDPNAPTSEEQAKQEQTPESIANYQTWLATYGGGTTAAAGTTAVSGEVGQPGSEVIVDTGAGEPVTMFQSNDATNTLLAAPVGVVPSGTKIETVEAGKDTPAFKAVQNKLSRISRRGTVQKVYGIAGLNPDGSLLTTINGKAAMSMPLPSDVSVPAGKSLKVYLIDDNGQTTKLDTAIDQGRVVFEIPKFGTFAFVVE